MPPNRVQITIQNNLRVSDLPVDLRNQLIERLTLPNPQYLENVRMGRWTRGIPKQLTYYHKWKQDGLYMPRGYIRSLIALCRKHHTAYAIDDRRRSLTPVDFGFKGRLMAFQKEAAARMLAKEFGTLGAPTGAGKTVMALYMIAQRRQPALIVVHTKDLAHQWLDRIGSFMTLADADIGWIGGGRMRIGHKITVALVQSLYPRVEKVSPRIGFLVVDECHRTPSRTFTEAVSEFDARYMLGLTATPYRRDKLANLIFWHLGDLHHQIDRKALVHHGAVLAAKVYFRPTEFKPYYDPVHEYSKMLSELTSDDQRNHMIAADVAREARSKHGVCLVLSDRKRHCETLRALLKYGHQLDAEVMTGDLTADQRQQVLTRLRRGEVRVLIATGQLIGEGFDCDRLTTLFLTTPIRFSGRVVQYLGRVLRPAPQKAHARVFDYVDVQVEPLKKAARQRHRIYGADNIVEGIYPDDAPLVGPP